MLAVKIFRDDDLGGEQRPRLGHLDVFLLENDLAGVVGDFGGAPLPFDLVERLDFRVAENAFDGQRFFPVLLPAFISRDALTFAVRRRPACGAGAKTSSRASIMIVSSIKFFRCQRPAVSDKAETRRASNIVNLPPKTDFFQHPHPPISWGTAAILPLPVVEFKKNFQKSYKCVIPK